ncbi:MAG TPA: hypothetical protein PK854_06125 [Oscillospiraceae bacterium]|nr:hypothetical protein [Oscillospiraceae bacterium]HPS34823.1 hypothetical protein [Oscillospiraceae bacterium]
MDDYGNLRFCDVLPDDGKGRLITSGYNNLEICVTPLSIISLNTSIFNITDINDSYYNNSMSALILVHAITDNKNLADSLSMK